MDPSEDIPVEIRARVEAAALFDALRSGDYTVAAQAQESLRVLGWHLSREPVPQRRVTRQKPRREADGREVGHER